MSRREDFDNAFWSDPDVEVLGADATLLYIWSWTNPRCGMAGVYKVSKRGMTESKLTPDQIDAALAELEEHDFLYYRDNVLFVRGRVKRLRQKTRQIAIAIANDLRVLPDDHPVRVLFLTRNGHFVWLREALGTLTGGSAVSAEKSQYKGQSLEPQPRLLGTGNGTGTGTGLGGGVQGRGARRRWETWHAEHLPDLPFDVVASACSVLDACKIPVTADVVRRRVLDRFPDLAGAS